jgi:hypothetical protein
MTPNEIQPTFEQLDRAFVRRERFTLPPDTLGYLAHGYWVVRVEMCDFKMEIHGSAAIIVECITSMNLPPMRASVSFGDVVTCASRRKHPREVRRRTAERNLIQMKPISLYRADLRGENPDREYTGFRDRLRLAWAVFVGRLDVVETEETADERAGRIKQALAWMSDRPIVASGGPIQHVRCARCGIVYVITETYNFCPDCQSCAALPISEPDLVRIHEAKQTA